MSKVKRKNKIEEITTRAGMPTKKSLHEQALAKLEEAKILAENKPIYFAKKGEGEFKKKTKSS